MRTRKSEKNHSPRAFMAVGRSDKAEEPGLANRYKQVARPCFEMSGTITISYDLKPPTDTPQSSLTPSKTKTFAVKDGESYYANLRATIATAKGTVGKELTEWRDQVGDLEKGKDGKPPKTQTGADDDEEEEEEGK